MSTVPSSSPPAARSSPIRCALDERRLYQTELTVEPPHEDSDSPGSSVAPTTVPLIVAGRLRIGYTLARSSFAGAGVVGTGAGVAASAPEDRAGPESAAEAAAAGADTITATSAQSASGRAITPTGLQARRIGC
jgi:hypothetical protein